MEQIIYNIVSTVNSVLSNKLLVVMLVGSGLVFSIRTRFVQVRYFKDSLKTFGAVRLSGKKNSGISSYQALATAVAAQIGTGNIVGASGAILTGGPGAIFWMWIIAFLGMATIYAEATLAQQTKIKDADGQVSGGPVYYITKAFKGPFGKVLAVWFAVAAVLALGFMGAMVQSNSIGYTLQNAFGIPAWVVGIILAIVCGFIFIGGVKRLVSVTEKIVPVMAVLFLLGGLVILIARIRYLPATFAMIFKYAFQPNAIIGGAFGYALKTAISQGVKRGLFSNEAGMGSTPHAHALADVKEPHEQGIVAMSGVFLDTFVVLTMNALVIISTLYMKDGIISLDNMPDFINKTNLAQTAFGSVMGKDFGSIFVAICLLFFAFSTVLSWNLFGKVNIQWLFGKKGVVVYQIIAIIFVFLGTTLNNDTVWEITDMFNNLMVIPNVLAIVTLSGDVVKSLKKHEENAA